VSSSPDAAVTATGPSTEVRAVLFDYGGVLAEGPFEAFALYERNRGLPEGFIRTLNSTNHHDNAWARFERSELGFDEFCDAFEAEARDSGGSLDTRELFATISGSLRPEMVEAVRRCSVHFKTGLLTNNFVSAQIGSSVAEDRRDGLIALFDVVVESSRTGIRKPDPRFYLLACEQLDIRPEEAVFLDDLGINLKPARELGMITIKVEDPSQALDDLETVTGIELR
jgi:putative hydrolase of the HAD superfamily